jgi:IclR family transcriptional regulator, KDG regulon repressor
VKQLFILTSPRFYLQCGGRQAKLLQAPASKDRGARFEGTHLPRAANSRSRIAVSTSRAPAGSSQSLQKALRILLHMGQKGAEMGVTQLSAGLKLNKTTVYRLLNAMEKFEVIEKSPESDRYRLGLKLHELGARAVESRTLRSEAHRFLQRLAHESHEAVSLAVPGTNGIVCLDRVDSRQSVISVRTPAGAKFPAHCTAAGKAVLAYLPGNEIDAILAANGQPRFTPSTITRASELKAQLRQIVKRGYALDNQELERGLSGVAAPIWGRDGKIAGALGMAGPTTRFQGRELAKKIALTVELAGKIGASLGH